MYLSLSFYEIEVIHEGGAVLGFICTVTPVLLDHWFLHVTFSGYLLLSEV